MYRVSYQKRLPIYSYFQDASNDNNFYLKRIIE